MTDAGINKNRDALGFIMPNGLVRITCPWCGKPHIHGGFGHRVAHCTDRPYSHDGYGYTIFDARLDEGETP